METIIIDDTEYYFAHDIMAKYPRLSNTNKNKRLFLRENSIPENKYIFIRMIDGEWKQSAGISCKHDIVVVDKSYFDITFDKRDIKKASSKGVIIKTDNKKSIVMTGKTNKGIDNEMVSKKTVVATVDKSNDKVIDNKAVNKNVVVNKNTDLPPIINLGDHEKFYNSEGNIVEIEMVGTRNYDDCYFRVKDIMKGFDLTRIDKVITNKDHDGYVEGIHYKYFTMEKKSFNRTKGKKDIIVRKLYVTYHGILRILFASKRKSVKQFVDWAMKTLFAAQMGTPDQKFTMIGKTLGVSSSAVKEVFNKTATTISCIYLFSIGKVKYLRKYLNLDTKWKDEDYVFKFGMTTDLPRRTGEHETTFRKMKGSSLELVSMGLIDPQYISNAETKLKHFFEGMNLIVEHEKYEEIVVIPREKMKLIKEQYEIISSRYIGHISELVTKLKEKDYEITLLKKNHELELQKAKSENEIQKERFEAQKGKLEIELLKKDLEIANLKLRK